MRTIVAFAVRRRVTVLMTALALAAFGIVGYQRLALDLLPDINYPSLTVQTEFPDTAPAEVENLVTRPVEETVGVLRGLRTIHSVSRPGISEVTLEFDWGANMDLLAMDVREKLDRLALPEGTRSPIVLRFDPALDPILRLALAGGGDPAGAAHSVAGADPAGGGDPASGADLTALRRIADLRLKQEFETLAGVAAAQVKGGLQEEIQVNVDQERLAALGIPLERVTQMVGASNVNLPGGALRDRESQYLIRAVNEFGSVEEIGGLIVQQQNGAVVRLRDVADVRRGTREREEITRAGGLESVEIDIYKEGDANIVNTARAVRARIAELQAALPGGSRLVVLFDQSRFIRQALAEVRGAALIGGLLAILVLLAFLREARSTLIITTSIPLSILATFIAMYRLDISINIMSLGGLTLGIGMLVDNSIVVLEAIFRRRQEGLSLRAAAVEGTDEVGGAVVASTLTTVAVFLPIVFVEGIAGQLFGDMAMTVTLSLLASLLVAVTLIPMLSALGRDRRAPAPAGVPVSFPGAAAHAAAGGGAGAASQIAGAAAVGEPPMTLGWFSRFYDGMLRGALGRRWRTVSVAAVLFGAAVLAFPLLDSELIPSVSEGEFFFEVTMPEGTPLAVTDRALRQMETAAAAEPGVEHTFVTAGSRLAAGGVALNTRAEHLGQLNVVLADRRDERGEAAVAERLRERFAAIPDATVKHGRPTYFSLQTPVEILLFGEDLALLESYARRLEAALAGVPGLVDLRSSFAEGSPELQIVFDRARLAALGLDMRRLSDTLRDRLQGAVPTRFKEDDRQIDVRVRNRESDRATLAGIRNLVVPGPDGAPVRLLTVAQIREGRGPAEIHRVGQQRAAVLTGNLQGRSLGAVTAAIERVIAQEPPPRGVSVELGGQNEEMKVSFASLRFALALAVFLVYLVMAATFESLLHPFIVLFAIPLAAVGVVAGLFVTGTQVSVLVLIGAVMLAGIVVNNAIVLIDKINQLRRGGAEKVAAIRWACHVRLRPILMTTLTTVLGLLPMALALGEGAELRSPLAVTVSFGLIFSTALTLIVIPAVYALVPSRIDPAGDPARAGRTHAS